MIPSFIPQVVQNYPRSLTDDIIEGTEDTFKGNSEEYKYINIANSTQGKAEEEERIMSAQRHKRWKQANQTRARAVVLTQEYTQLMQGRRDVLEKGCRLVIYNIKANRIKSQWRDITLTIVKCKSSVQQEGRHFISGKKGTVCIFSSKVTGEVQRK